MTHQLSFLIRETYSTTHTGVTIEVTLSLGGTAFVGYAKIDPRAQVCLFKREIGETLGLDIETGYRCELNTLAGSLTAYGHAVTLHTLGLEFDSLIYFAADYGLPRNLLGREGWLQNVRLAIVDYDATLYLSPYQE
jgi:hypothetical protein